MINNFEKLWIISGIIVLCIIALTVLSGIILLVYSVVKAYKLKNYKKLRYNLTAVLFVLIAAVSFVLNMGWLRFVMILSAIPFIHSIVFFFMEYFAAAYIEKSHKLKIITIITYITYLFAYLFLPDGGDIGPMYAFFTLLRGDIIIGLCFGVSAFSFCGNIIGLIAQFFIIVGMKIKNRRRQKMCSEK